MKKNLFFLFLIFLIFAAVVIIKNQCNSFFCLIDSPELNSFSLQETYENSQNTYRALYEKNQDKIRVTIQSGISRSEAKNNIETRMGKIIGLFLNTFAPYPGEISYKTTCDKKFMPDFKTSSSANTKLWWSPLFYNATFTSGVCSEDQIQYKGFIAFIYCEKQKKIVQMEYIVPKNSSIQSESIIEATRCK